MARARAPSVLRGPDGVDRLCQGQDWSGARPAVTDNGSYVAYALEAARLAPAGHARCGLLFAADGRIRWISRAVSADRGFPGVCLETVLRTLRYSLL